MMRVKVSQNQDRTWQGYFYRGDLSPRLESEPFATREDAERWTREAVRDHWKTPGRKVDEYGTAIVWGRYPYCAEFDYGTGHGVSNWSPAKWEAVHKLQKQYLRETAKAWKDATAECLPQLDRFDELQRAKGAKSVPAPIGGAAGRKTTARGCVNKYTEGARKEFDEIGPHFAPRWPESLRETLREAAARRDKLVANLGEI